MNNNHRRLVSTTLSLLLALSSAGPSAWAATARAVPVTGAATMGLPALPSALPGLSGLPSASPLTTAAAPVSAEAAALGVPVSGTALQTPAAIAAVPVSVVPARPSLEARQTFAKVQAFAASAQAPARAERPSLLGRLVSAVSETLSLSSLFDAARPAPAAGLSGAMGFRPLPRQTLPAGSTIDVREGPTHPLPAQAQQVNIQAFEIPGVRNAGGVFDAGPRVLQADPASEADMERALREAVDLDAARYGVTSAELSTVHVRRVEGKDGQADTVYAYFRQQKNSTNTDGTTQKVSVHGSYLSFTVKVVKDKPVLMAAMARLYPSLAANTGASMTDAQLKDRAEQQLPQGAGITLEYLERKVIYHEGAWKTVNLYTIEGLPIPIGVLVAVEVATGEVFAWDSRLGIDDAPPAPAPAGAVSGTAAGRAETSDTRPNGQPDLKQVALPHLSVSVGGKAGITDKDGRFSSTADQPVDFTATLSGSYAQVNDRAGKPLKVSTTLTPGQDATVVFNPAGQDELTVSQVNAFAAVNRVHDWVQSKLAKNESRLDRAIPVNVNINQDCNAYYTPGRPSLNFFKSSRRCSDTARPGVVSHEYGHFVDDMIGGIVNGGLSEGWGDILSMYILGSPIIGDGFLKNTTPSYIRHGENDYQYSDNDEVHDQGQAWMGFAWKLRKGLIASLGEAAGAAVAEAVVVPTLYAKASDIPAAMAQVLLNDMDKDGNLPHEKEIRAAAKAHGVDLPKNPGVIVALWNGATAGLRRLTMGAVLTDTSEPGGALPDAAPFTPGARPDAALTNPPASTERIVRARLTFTAGALIRGQVRREIQRYLDYHKASGLTGELKEYKGVFSSDFLLTMEGPEPIVQHLIAQLEAMGNR